MDDTLGPVAETNPKRGQETGNSGGTSDVFHDATPREDCRNLNGDSIEPSIQPNEKWLLVNALPGPPGLEIDGLLRSTILTLT